MNRPTPVNSSHNGGVKTVERRSIEAIFGVSLRPLAKHTTEAESTCILSQNDANTFFSFSRSVEFLQRERVGKE